jgi:hypothetical protein
MNRYTDPTINFTLSAANTSNSIDVFINLVTDTVFPFNNNAFIEANVVESYRVGIRVSGADNDQGWTFGPQIFSTDPILDDADNDGVTDGPYTLQLPDFNIDPNTTYDIIVRARCYDGFRGPWSSSDAGSETTPDDGAQACEPVTNLYATVPHIIGNYDFMPFNTPGSEDVFVDNAPVGTTGAEDYWKDFAPYGTVGAEDFENVELRPDSVYVNWDAPIGAAPDRYEVQWRQRGSTTNWNTAILIGDVAPIDLGYTNTEYGINGLLPGTPYRVRVRAICESDPLSPLRSAFNAVNVDTPLPKLEQDHNAPESTIAFVVYPNPNNGQFAVKFDAEAAGEVTLRVMDVQGKFIYNQSFNINAGVNELPVEISSFSAGVYNLQFIHNGSMKAVKLVLN